MVIGYINGMEIYYRTFCGKGGGPLGGYFVSYIIYQQYNKLVKLIQQEVHKSSF